MMLKKNLRIYFEEKRNTSYLKFKSILEKSSKKDYSKAQEVTLAQDTPNPLWVVDLLKNINAITSSSEAKRLIESGAVHIDGYPEITFKTEVAWRAGMTLKVGKHRIYKIV
jgi:tyrosyl-tRNA synthetase